MKVKLFRQQHTENELGLEERINEFASTVYVINISMLPADAGENIPPLIAVMYDETPRTLKQYAPNIERRGRYQ